MIHSDMSDEKFREAAALKAWLKGKDVDPEKAAEVYEALFDKGYDLPSTLIGVSYEELTGYGISNPVARHISNKLRNQPQEDAQTRFRRLAESAAINVTEPVMKSVVFHFASQMAVVNTAGQAADLYKRASRIPRTATERKLKEKNISIAGIFGGTDTGKSIILEAFESGKPCLLKITDSESIDHEIDVWEAIKETDGDRKNYLVPLRKLEFESANIQVGNLPSGYSDSGNYRTGILMRKYQSTLSRCAIPLTEEVLLRYGEQLKTAISAMYKRGYCHVDIKPANIFLWEEECLLGDYGGATKIGEMVRENTRAYYPSDVGSHAKKETVGSVGRWAVGSVGRFRLPVPSCIFTILARSASKSCKHTQTVKSSSVITYAHDDVPLLMGANKITRLRCLKPALILGSFHWISLVREGS